MLKNVCDDSFKNYLLKVKGDLRSIEKEHNSVEPSHHEERINDVPSCVCVPGQSLRIMKQYILNMLFDGGWNPVIMMSILDVAFLEVSLLCDVWIASTRSVTNFETVYYSGQSILFDNADGIWLRWFVDAVSPCIILSKVIYIYKYIWNILTCSA